jgi:hypothetical protein
MTFGVIYFWGNKNEGILEAGDLFNAWPIRVKSNKNLSQRWFHDLFKLERRFSRKFFMVK